MSSKPTTIFKFHHKCYRNRSMRVFVFKTHHNFQFSPQMLHNQIDESLCLRNPPPFSVFTTHGTEQNQRVSMSSKPTTIFSFHHKCYRTRSMRIYVFKTHHDLQFSPQMLQNQSMRVYVFKTHHNFQFSPQMLQKQIDESLRLQNPPQSSVFTTNVTETDR